MNERALDVLEQFGIETRKYVRGRGGLIVNSGNEHKLLYECIKSAGFYERENKITKSLAKTDFEFVDTYNTTNDGGIFAEDVQGRKHILKNWHNGRECDIKNVEDVLLAVRTLAKLHCNMKKMERSEELLKYNNATDIRMKFDKHTKEMRMVSNFLKGKKNKNDYEMLLQKSIAPFHKQALKAITKVGEFDYGRRLENARINLELCHGGYTYHNVFVLNNGIFVSNFDHVCVDCQIMDLYQFMRKVLEKNDWNVNLGNEIIKTYQDENKLEDVDLKILEVNLIYPEKFWKILNFYHGSNKSWIPRKNLEKLEQLISQEEERQKFLETLHL